MRFNYLHKFLLLTFVSAFISCKSALYMPTEANVSSGTTLPELTEGRTQYVNNCGSCHTLHLPSEFSHDKWQKEIDEMQARAKIDDRTKQLILNYLWNAPAKLN